MVHRQYDGGSLQDSIIVQVDVADLPMGAPASELCSVARGRLTVSPRVAHDVFALSRVNAR
jgi:hypothetical protein